MPSWPEATPVRLPVPDGGGPTIAHDAGFVALDRGLGAVRDVVNEGVDLLNSLGAGLPRLPEGSLEELLVLPLAGDHAAIRANAVALADVHDALVVHANDVARLGLAVDPRWGGRSASAYVARVGAHALAVHGLAEGVALGVPAMAEAARFSERLAVVVERLVMELVEVGERVVRRILVRLLGPAGWAVTAAEIAVRGFEVVTDIVDDVQRLLAIVEELRALQDDVVGWVDEQRERLTGLLTTLRLQEPTDWTGVLAGT